MSSRDLGSLCLIWHIWGELYSSCLCGVSVVTALAQDHEYVGGASRYQAHICRGAEEAAPVRILFGKACCFFVVVFPSIQILPYSFILSTPQGTCVILGKSMFLILLW